MSTLRSLLRSWSEQESEMDHQALAYLLYDKYENISLSRAKLKGRDHLVVSQLKETCDDSGFYIYLAKLEKTAYGYSDWQEIEH
jgi:hypothetical protein